MFAHPLYCQFLSKNGTLKPKLKTVSVRSYERDAYSELDRFLISIDNNFNTENYVRADIDRGNENISVYYDYYINGFNTKTIIEKPKVFITVPIKLILPH